MGRQTSFCGFYKEWKTPVHFWFYDLMFSIKSLCLVEGKVKWFYNSAKYESVQCNIFPVFVESFQ